MSTYNPGCPLPFDIPADSQDEFLTNFQRINNIYAKDHIAFGNTIINATSANPCVITSPSHRLSTGNNITVYTLDGLDPNKGQVLWTINGNSYNVTKIDDNTFSIPVDTTNEAPYIANSGDFLVNTPGYGYGYHKQITYSDPTVPQGRAAPISSLFSQTITQRNKAQQEITKNYLTFENNPNSLFQLTGLGNLVSINTTDPNKNLPYNHNAIGFKTAFGITINIGAFGLPGPATQPLASYNYPIPYTTTNYFTILTLSEFVGQTTVTTAYVSSSNLTSFSPKINPNKPNNPNGKIESLSIYYISFGK